MKKMIFLIILLLSTNIFAQFTQPDTTYYDDVARGLKNTSTWQGMDSGKVVAALNYIVNFADLVDSVGLATKAQQDSLLAAINELNGYVQLLTLQSQSDTANARISQSNTLLQLIRAAVEGTLDVSVSNQISDFATDTKLELVRLLLVSIDGKNFATSAGLDSVEINIEETNALLQQMENRQGILQDSINVLNATQLVIKGILGDSKTAQDSTLENLKENNVITQDIENRISVIQDSLNVLNASINVLKGYLNDVESNQLSQIVIGDTTNQRISQALTLLQYVRAAIEGTLDVNVTNQITGYGTEAKQQETIDSLISVISELKSRSVVVDSIITIGTTAVQLPDISCKEFSAMNLSPTETVFFSTDPTIANTDDEYPLMYREGISDRVNNPNKYWAVSTGAGTKIKIKAVR